MILRGLTNKWLIRTLLLLSIAAAAAGFGCTGEKNATEEKGGRDKITDQTVNAAVKIITTPVQRARETSKLADEREQEIARALKKQEPAAPQLYFFRSRYIS